MAATNALYGLPATPVLGSYGGGDDMMMARQLVARRVRTDAVPAEILESVYAAVDAAVRRNCALPRAERVARLPDSAPVPGSLAMTAHVHVSSRVYGVDDGRSNLFAHGFVHAEAAAEPGRRGAAKFPLIGLYGPVVGVAGDPRAEPGVGGGDGGDGGCDGVASVGWGELRWCDCHIHKVDDGAQGPWHFGSDMARLRLDGAAPFAHAWVVCADLDAARCDVQLLVVVRGDLEEAADAAVAEANAATDEADEAGWLAALAGGLEARAGGAAGPALLAELRAAARRLR